MSADGKRVLVACLADSAFYMVDVETGAYRKLHSQFFQDNTYGITQYGIDQQCRWLVIQGTDLRNGVARPVFRVEDTETGEIVLEQEPGITIRGVSQRQDRLMSNTQLIKLSTFELIREYPKETPSGLGAWFDDDRGLVYRARPREAQEIDAETGEIRRSWTVRPITFHMLRPSNSDWLYVFSTETDGLSGGSQNLVEAINLVTSEKLTFTRYFWTLADGFPWFSDQPQCFTSSSSSCFAIGDDNTPHYNAVWEFDAESSKSAVVTDLRFFYHDRYQAKTLVITPDKSRLLHCWAVRGGDSSILRCNSLVPVATSAHENSSDDSSRDVSVVQRDNSLTIELVHTNSEELITNVQIFTSDGIVVARVPVSDASIPVTFSIGHLSSGAYRCVVTTTGRELFASFTIVR
ncbi:MAG: hypothetical protein EHM43_02905 [Ignavibacteriae bacterium]|nr:MAG: hypothetical protein EHM43_02905 [Ignavibacteriota bacterium]